MFSNLLFIIEIFICGHLFAFRLKHRNKYALRLVSSAAICIGVGAFLGLFFVENVFYSFFVYIALFAVSILALWFTYDEPIVNIFFCGIAAYTTQHFAYQFANLVFTLVMTGASPLLGIYHIKFFDITKLNANFLLVASIYVMCYFTIYALVYLIFGRRIQKQGGLEIKNKNILVLLGFCLILNIVLNSVMLYLGDHLPFVNSVIFYIYICLCCCLLLQWHFELSYSKCLSTELDFVKKLLQQEKEHYKLFRDNIQIIDIKCHDMKHQIRQIGINKGLASETVEEIEKSISIYDSDVKTDNEALDVILTEKSLKCIKYNITFSCMADGKRLNFMKDSDVYSLFGNALDNAIEAVIKLKDKSQRVIGLKVCAVGDMTSINVKNFYDGKIEFNKEGIPDSTKLDKDFHGFGLKSIAMIVEKYGGSLSIVAHDEIFNLNILLPGQTSK